jgi:hypothetical protein
MAELRLLAQHSITPPNQSQEVFIKARAGVAPRVITAKDAHVNPEREADLLNAYRAPTSRPSIGHSGDDLNDQKGNADREATVPAGFSGQLSPLPQRLVSNSSCMSIWLSVARQAAIDVDVTRSTQRVS